MAITINNLPPFAYTENPIPVIFESDVAATETVIEFKLFYGAGPSTGSVIGFSFDNEFFEVVYNFASFNDFYIYLSSHYIIKRYFSVTTTGIEITLTSFQKESLNASIVTDSNFAPCTVTVADGGIEKVDVLLGLNIWNGTSYIPTGFDKSHKVQLDGLAYFNIAEAFSFEKVAILTTALTAFEAFVFNTIQYQLEFAEYRNNVLAQASKASELFAVNGAFNQAYLETAIVAENFLTASKRTIFSKDDEPRFLSFINTGGFSNLLLILVAHGSDGTNSYEFEIEVTSAKGDIVNVPVGYNQIGMDALGGSPFWKYDIKLEFDDNTGQTYESEIFTIECNRQVSLNYSTFLFINSRGGIDTISFDGELEESTTFDRLEYQRSNRNGLNEKRTEQHRLQQNYKQYSGYYDDRELFNYIEELLNSKQVWFYENGELKPIIIENQNFEKGSIHDDIFEMEFDFSLVFDAVAADINFAPVAALDVPNISIEYPTQIGYVNSVD